MSSELADKKSLLLIEDDEVFALTLSRALSKRGFYVMVANSLSDAVNIAENQVLNFVILDLNLKGESGLGLIPLLIDLNPMCKIVVLTGYASIATTVQAIKMGATQYLAKPVDINAILKALLEDGDFVNFVDENPLRIDRVEWEHIQRILTENNGNISATARCLKMHRRTLQRKLRKRPSSF